MQTANFQCGHCGNLMAVGVEFLGQQLLCPHCQQVVIAPADAAPPAPAEPLLQSLARSEDIFHQPNPDDDPLFGPASHSRPDVLAAPALSADPAHAVEGPPVGFAAPEQLTVDAAPARSWMDPAPPTDGPAAVEATPPAARKPRDYSGRVNWFIPLVFIPLVLYAVLCTAVAGYLYLKLRTQPTNPFDSFPDWEGDTPGVRKEKPKLSYDRKFATQPLPEHLLVGLGKTIRVGDLEVTPTRVERRRVELMAEGPESKPEPSPTDALVLHLRLKNVAEDYAFTPLDNFFDRHWRPGNDGAPPLTLLQAGEETFFGGPAKWHPLGRGRKERREWLQGRANVDRDGLSPGKAQETLVATDAWDPAVARFLFGVNEEGEAVQRPYAGKLLWRVQLRRGLVDWKGRRLPATAVVGVEFTDADYSARAG